MTDKVVLRPITGNILVEPLEEDNDSPSGIVIPDTINKEKPQRGKVLAIGPERLSKDGEKIPYDVKVGDTVLFKKYAPNEFEVEGEEYMIMSEKEILGIFN